jgi:4-amino-4-deoxy-L-arabinose transferase-like glycosyltransferase
LPLLAAAALLFMARGRQGLSVRTHAFGLLVLGATILPWLFPYLLQTEADYGEAVIKGDYLNWFFGGAPSSGTWLFPVFSVMGGFLPWTPFLLASFWERGGEPEAWRRHRRWIALWTLTLFVVIGLSAAQRTKYLLPVYPGLALVVAHSMARWSGARRAGRLRWGTIAWGGIAIGLSGILAIGAAPELRALVSVFVPATATERLAASLFLLVGGVGGILAVYRRRHRAVLPLVGLSTAALLALIAANYPARQAAAFDLKRFALEISPHVGEGSAIAFYRTNNLSFDFYLRRPLKEFHAAEQALQFMARPTPAFLLMEDADWRALNRVTPSTWRVVAEGFVSKRKLVLIGNRS